MLLELLCCWKGIRSTSVMIRTPLKHHEDAQFGPESEIKILDEDTFAFLKSLVSNKNMNRHQPALQKIYQFVVDSADNEREWSSKCQTLQGIIQSNRSKVEAAKLLGKEDRLIIDSLKAELEKSWQTIDKACESEKKARESKAYIEKKLEKLQASYPTGDGKKASRSNEKIQEENQELRDKLGRYESKLTHLKNNQLKAEDEIVELKKHLEKKSKTAESTKEKLAKEMKRKEDLEKETKKLKAMLEIAKTQTPEKSDSQFSNVVKLQKQLVVKTKALEKAQQQFEANKGEIAELQDSFRQHEQLIGDLAEEKENITCALRLTHGELLDVKKELEDMKISHNKLLVENSDVDTKNNVKYLAGKNLHIRRQNDELFERYKSVAMSLEKLRTQNTGLMNECNRLRITENELRNMNQELMVVKNEVKDRKDETQSQTLEEETKSLKAQISQQTIEVEKHLILIRQLEKVRDKYINELSTQEQIICSLKMETASFKYVNFPEKLEAIQKKLNDAENMLKTRTGQSTAYENVLKEELDALKLKLDLKESENTRLHETIVNQKTEFNSVSQKSENPESITIFKDINIEDLKKKHCELKSDKNKLLSNVNLLMSERSLWYDRNKIQDGVIERGQKQYKLKSLEVKNLKAYVDDLQKNLLEIQEEVTSFFESQNSFAANEIADKNKEEEVDGDALFTGTSNSMEKPIKSKESHGREFRRSARMSSDDKKRAKYEARLKRRRKHPSCDALNVIIPKLQETQKMFSSKRENDRFDEWYTNDFAEDMRIMDEAIDKL